MTRLFGTDGIRGRALEPPLDERTIRRLGAALAEELCGLEAAPSLLLAGDTRASTPVLAAWLSESFVAAGGRVTWAGVLPTPAVSHLLRSSAWTAGVVVSASHNPARDNGIKVLARSGSKLGDDVERRLEARLATVTPHASNHGLPPADPTLGDRYLELLLHSHRGERPLAGLRLVVDAANGAASHLAEPLFSSLGASVEVMHHHPDGANINRGCGAIAPEVVARQVTARGADAGLSLDGDADRAMLADELGQVLDGDDILLVWARALAAAGDLPGGEVVATVMSNLGLERALAGDGLRVRRCAVGDRAVWIAMSEHGAALGGEQSGHVICAHHTVSGDGLLTGSHVLAVAARSGRTLSTCSDMVRLPQVLTNVPVRRREPLDGVAALRTELESAERTLAGRGRVLLRYSGTEPLLRVMVEGDDASEIRALADQLAAIVTTHLG